ncbi:MAG: Lrp/AsnC ligand binding domain-containing protein, partial [Actinobacteria bacterium]|nr:Lrp/AsnC ligand binding domain-containing protein [Actinomycetota bacterium]
EPGRTRETADRAAGLAGRGVRQSVVITGEWDVLVAVEAENPEQLGGILMDQVLNDDAIAESHTAVVVEAEAAARPLLPLPMPVHSVQAMVALVFAKIDAGLGREAPQGWLRWMGGLGEALKDVEGVQGAAMVTGEYDLLVEVGGDDWGAVSQGILGVAALPGIGATTTAVAVTAKLVSSA